MKKITFISMIVFGIIACNSPKEKALKNIKMLEASDSIFSPQNIEATKRAYLDFANKYPDDDLAPEYIFKAAQRCNVMAEHEEALKLFNSIIEKYPKSPRSEEALFLQGFIYENSIKDLPKAQKVYLAFIEKYPNSDLAEDAKAAIKNLGKSPEEIFESFEKNDSTGVHP